MSETKLEVCVKVYVGMPEDLWVDHLYADLIVGDKEMTLPDCSEEVSGLSGSEFIPVLERILREAKYYAKALKLRVKIEMPDIIEALGGDDSNEDDIRKVRQVIRDFRENF